MATTTSWLAAVTEAENPCIGQAGAANSCILWFIAGMILASLTFEKKRPAGTPQ